MTAGSVPAGQSLPWVGRNRLVQVEDFAPSAHEISEVIDGQHAIIRVN